MQKHNRHTTRLQTWDYSSPGYYFITICTYKYECIFGEINNGKMELNEMGKIINDQWIQIPNKYKTVELNKFQIMPNHIHGIILLKYIVGASFMDSKIVGASFMKPNNKIQISKTNKHMGLINQTSTVGHIVRYFKTKCSYELHNKRINQKIWQRNYHDRIIRNKGELNKIRKYIQDNPLNWDKDENNPKQFISTT